MTIRLQSLTFNTPQLEKLVQFYRALGCALEEKEAKKGSKYYYCETGGVGLSFLSTSEKQGLKDREGVASLSFIVDDLDQVFEEVQKIESTIIMDPFELPSGREAVVLDPDGRSIELFEPA